MDEQQGENSTPPCTASTQFGHVYTLLTLSSPPLSYHSVWACVYSINSLLATFILPFSLGMCILY